MSISQCELSVICAPPPPPPLTEHACNIAADIAALKLRALQDHSRKQALASLGISRSSSATDGKRRGKRISDMVKDWEDTYETVLTRRQKMVRMRLGHCRVVDAVKHNKGDQAGSRNCSSSLLTWH